MKLLLVDDDPDIVMVARFALERAGGHRVTTAGSAAEALERAREEIPDAIVLDLLLPDADGLEVLDRLRREPGLERVPVVFLTGKADDERRDRLLGAGAVGVIAKPFDPLVLNERIERLVGVSSGPAARTDS